MLQFITLIFPGILFAYVAEYLMKRRLDTHHFIFLSLFNILTINFIAMLLRDVFTVFLTSDDYKLVVESMENSIKQIVFSGIVGVPLALLEALADKYLSLRLEDSAKQKQDEENRK